MADFIAEKQSPQKVMIKQYLLLTEDILFLYFASLNTWQAAQSFDVKNEENYNILMLATRN
jgi:hypothetical protein